MKYDALLEKKMEPVAVRRCSLPTMISESYKSYYECKKGSNLQKLVEAHLDDVRKNPTDTDRLSYQLAMIKQVVRMTESGKIKDEELLVPKEEYNVVNPTKETLDLAESKEEELEQEMDEADSLEDPDLTDEEVAELTKHLESIRKAKNAEKSQPVPKKEMEEGIKPRKLKRHNEAIQEEVDPSPELQDAIMTRLADVIYGFGVDPNSLGDLLDDLVYNIAKLAPAQNESKNLEEGAAALLTVSGKFIAAHWREILAALEAAGVAAETIVDVIRGVKAKENAEIGECADRTYESLDLSEFTKKSASKAFVKTFKKLDSKLREGKALTRQESIALYKATNSALTHLSVELEHNPEFLTTFKESVALLSSDAIKVLESLKEGKGPSKSTMKSLAKFSEALLREEDEEELPPIEDEEEVAVAEEEGEEESAVSEEEEEFDQEYAEARVELHKDLVKDHGEDEEPAVIEKLQQDAEEVVSLPGIADEDAAEIMGEELGNPEEEEAPEDSEEEEEVEESVHDEDVEEVHEEKEKPQKSYYYGRNKR